MDTSFDKLLKNGQNVVLQTEKLNFHSTGVVGVTSRHQALLQEGGGKWSDTGPRWKHKGGRHVVLTIAVGQDNLIETCSLF